jgi:hypothetical protein
MQLSLVSIGKTWELFPSHRPAGVRGAREIAGAARVIAEARGRWHSSAAGVVVLETAAGAFLGSGGLFIQSRILEGWTFIKNSNQAPNCHKRIVNFGQMILANTSWLERGK